MKAGYVSELEALDGEMARLKEEMEGLALDYAGNGEMAAAFGKYLGGGGADKGDGADIHKEDCLLWQ